MPKRTPLTAKHMGRPIDPAENRGGGQTFTLEELNEFIRHGLTQGICLAVSQLHVSVGSAKGSTRCVEILNAAGLWDAKKKKVDLKKLKAAGVDNYDIKQLRKL